MIPGNASNKYVWAKIDSEPPIHARIVAQTTHAADMGRIAAQKKRILREIRIWLQYVVERWEFWSKLTRLHEI